MTALWLYGHLLVLLGVLTPLARADTGAARGPDCRPDSVRSAERQACFEVLLTSLEVGRTRVPQSLGLTQVPAVEVRPVTDSVPCAAAARALALHRQETKVAGGSGV
jgi:hypothetical protein